MVESSQPLATFEFICSGYDITKQSDKEVHIDIVRFLKRTPYPGMKQPTPHGGMLGSEVRLIIRYQGLRAAKYRFNLFLDDECIQSGAVDDRGEYSGLRIRRFFCEEPKTYKLEILEPINEKPQECNTEYGATYEPDRLGDPPAYLRDSAD